MAYAREHQGAVNIWVYHAAGQVVHFERMDGARATAGGTALDPGPPDPSYPGTVAVMLNRENIGRVRVEGMGAAADHTCALAAAAAAK